MLAIILTVKGYMKGIKILTAEILCYFNFFAIYKTSEICRN